MTLQRDCIKMLIDTERALLRARSICVVPGVEDEINIAFDNVVRLGDTIYPNEIKKYRKAYSDKTG